MADFDSDLTVTLGLNFIQSSVVRHEGAVYALIEMDDGRRRLAIEVPTHLRPAEFLKDFVGESSVSDKHTLLLAPLTTENATGLRKHLSWLRPSVQGLRTTVGLGDRLGLATPGHLQAVREAGGELIPFPAQQSIREMHRTGRTPQQVMDDAMWGIFAEGWHNGFGADADHLKTPADIDYCTASGYTFYTFDPGEYVDGGVDAASASELQARLDALPWEQLEDSLGDLRARYLPNPVSCEGYVIAFDEDILARAAVKYGRAVAHVTQMYRHLAQTVPPGTWEVEISVDETETPTTHAEHVYIASELSRLGVRWVSLAPRYIGRFEKGVDYIGDIGNFEADIAVHAAIARTLGPYKLSLHSGSDKFSIYAPAVRQTRGLIHLKTAGTSYLEALRTISRLEPPLLRSIYIYAREHYEADRASYHVSAQLSRAPEPDSLSDDALPSLLDQFDAREILHVTFGTILTARNSDGHFLFYDRLMNLLRTHPAAYAADLKAHFLRHLLPFAAR